VLADAVLADAVLADAARTAMPPFPKAPAICMYLADR
jgi:hypothetical protein